MIKGLCFLIVMLGAFCAHAQKSTENASDSSFYARTLDEAKKDPLNVTDLNLSGYAELPRVLSTFKNLRKLVLDDSRIRKIPDDYPEIPRLRVIVFMGNSIIPVGLSNFKELEGMIFHYELDDDLTFSEGVKLPDLEKIIFYRGVPNKLPVIFPNAKNIGLHQCDVGNITLPYNLNYLVITDCKHDSMLLKNLARYSQLQKLDIAISGMSNIPIELSKLKQLQSLDLYSVDITKLPDFLIEMKNLKELRVSHLDRVSEESLEIFKKRFEKGGENRRFIVCR